MKRLCSAALGMSAVLVLCGCSVFMAASDREGTDLSVASNGVSRTEVEEVLGTPEASTATPEGEWVTYKYVKPKEGSGGRAVAHGVLDVLTLGIWEVAGTPIEAVGDDKYGRIQVLYDSRTSRVVRTRKITE
jgi:hypothetical protein